MEMMLSTCGDCDHRHSHAGRDGLWLAGQIRQRWSKTAIIMATSADDIATIEMSRQLGVVDYVLKPFGRELLHQAMQRASKAIVEQR